MNREPENALNSADDAWLTMPINGAEPINIKQNIPSWLNDMPPLEVYNDIIIGSHNNASSAAKVIKPTPLFNIEDARVGPWIDTEPPVRKYILENCLPCGKAGIIVAPGGTGKSQYAIQLLISAAIGMHLANYWAIGETGSVLALFAEEDTEELHRRLYNTVKALNLNDDKVRLIKERVFIKSVVGEDNFMTAKNETGEVAETAYLECLLMAVAGIKDLKLIIIDPISRFRGGNEIDNDDATRFVVVLEKLAKQTGATVIGLHHASKASMNEKTSNQSASRGASALVDGVRWVMNLQSMSDQESKQYSIKAHRRGYYVKCMVTKNNYAPPQSEEIWLERGEDGVLKQVVLHGSKEEFLEAKKEKILEIILREAELNREYSLRGFRDKYAGTQQEIGISDDKLRFLLQELLDERLIIYKTPKNPGKNIKKILAASLSLEEATEEYRVTADGR